MVNLQGFLDKLREKKSFIEGSQRNLPVGGNNVSLTEIYDRFLDPVNARQLAVITQDDYPFAAILDAYSYAENEYDVDGFLRGLVSNMFILSSSVDGLRSSQLQNIAVGQMNREFAMELANIRSGGNGEVKELKDVV